MLTDEIDAGAPEVFMSQMPFGLIDDVDIFIAIHFVGGERTPSQKPFGWIVNIDMSQRAIQPNTFKSQMPFGLIDDVDKDKGVKIIHGPDVETSQMPFGWIDVPTNKCKTSQISFGQTEIIDSTSSQSLTS